MAWTVGSSAGRGRIRGGPAPVGQDVPERTRKLPWVGARIEVGEIVHAESGDGPHPEVSGKVRHLIHGDHVQAEVTLVMEDPSSQGPEDRGRIRSLLRDEEAQMMPAQDLTENLPEGGIQRTRALDGLREETRERGGEGAPGSPQEADARRLGEAEPWDGCGFPRLIEPCGSHELEREVRGGAEESPGEGIHPVARRTGDGSCVEAHFHRMAPPEFAERGQCRKDPGVRKGRLPPSAASFHGVRMDLGAHQGRGTPGGGALPRRKSSTAATKASGQSHWGRCPQSARGTSVPPGSPSMARSTSA